LKAAAGATPASLARKKMTVADELAPYDAMHVLALVSWAVAHTLPADTPIPLVPPSAVEYLATVLLERPHPGGTADPNDGPALRAAAWSALEQIGSIGARSMYARMIESVDAETAAEQLAADHRARETLFRVAGYPDQTRRALSEIFDVPEVNDALRGALGFDAAEALSLYDALESLLDRQLEAHWRFVDDWFAQVEEHYTRVRRAPEERRRALRSALGLGPDLVDAWSARVTTLAKESGRRWQIAERFLELFASRFGDTKGTTLLTGHSRVRQRPLVVDGAGRYLPTSLGNLFGALNDALEGALPKAIFDGPYQSNRARWVERLASTRLTTALEGCESWTNLRFDIDGGLNYEVDVLVRLDTVCLVVEAKGGRLSDRGRAGRSRALRDSLSDILGRATEQSGRLAAAIRRGEPPAFRDAVTEAPVAVDLIGVSRVEALVVTMEDLGWLATRHGALRELGLLPATGDPPWVVSAFDLDLICDMVGSPAELTHYLSLRRQLDHRIAVFDELELWLLYLDEGLDMSAVPGRYITLAGRVMLLDDVLLLGRGRLPKIKLRRQTRERISAAQSERSPGWLDYCELQIAEDQAGRVPTYLQAPRSDALTACLPRVDGIRQRLFKSVPS
jgi:hypothetical protein